MGEHTVGDIMKKMAIHSNLSNKRITNHSARKLSITTLKHANFDPLNITQLSGHRNLKSIDDYSAASDEQQRAMSFVITHRVQGKKQNLPWRIMFKLQVQP